MSARILVPTDGTERAIVALETALRLATMSQGMVIAVHASPPPYVMAPELGLTAPIHKACRRSPNQLRGALTVSSSCSSSGLRSSVGKAAAKSRM